jgi:hypothetical protein
MTDDVSLLPEIGVIITVPEGATLDLTAICEYVWRLNEILEEIAESINPVFKEKLFFNISYVGKFTLKIQAVDTENPEDYSRPRQVIAAFNKLVNSTARDVVLTKIRSHARTAYQGLLTAAVTAGHTLEIQAVNRFDIELRG